MSRIMAPPKKKKTEKRTSHRPTGFRMAPDLAAALERYLESQPLPTSKQAVLDMALRAWLIANGEKHLSPREHRR